MTEIGRNLIQSYEKKPLRPQKNPKSNETTQKRHQNFDYTTIADRLGTVGWSNDSHPTGVIKPVYGIPTSLLTAKGVITDTILTYETTRYSKIYIYFKTCKSTLLLSSNKIRLLAYVFTSEDPHSE